MAELNSRAFQRPVTLRSIEPARPVVVYERILNNIAHLVNRMNIERVRHTPSGQWSVCLYVHCSHCMFYGTLFY